MLRLSSGLSNFPRCESAVINWQEPSRGESNRCLRSAVPYCPTRASLLLDEPSLGLAPQIVSKIFGIIRDLKAQGTTILLVEQNAAAAVSVSDYVYVLNNGVIYIHGQTDQFGHGSELMNELTGVYV